MLALDTLKLFGPEEFPFGRLIGGLSGAKGCFLSARLNPSDEFAVLDGIAFLNR